jgi:hypothetical protein
MVFETIHRPPDEGGRIAEVRPESNHDLYRDEIHEVELEE